MKMDYHVTVVVLMFVHSISGQCGLKDDSGNDILWDKYKTHSLGEFEKTVEDGTQLPGIQLDGVRFDHMDSNDCGAFMDITSDDTHVTITAKNFANWDKDGNPSGQCLLTVVFITISCPLEPASIVLRFSYTVKDVNTMFPEFNKPSYSLNVPFPLPSGLDLTGALDVLIQTTDTDFSTKKITYTLAGDNADYFEALPLAPSNKVFPMSLLTKKLINSQKEFTLKVTATDDGTPSLGSTAQIIITPNLENSIPPVPEFTAPLKTVVIDPSTLEVGQEVAQPELKEAFEALTINIKPDTFFEAVLEGKIVHINLLKKFDSEAATYMTIEVQAQTNNGFNTASSTTIIILQFPGGMTPPEPTTPTTTDRTPSTPPQEKPEDTDSGLLAATIVLSISTAVLLIFSSYCCYKYIYLPRKV